MRQLFSKFLADQSGATAIEYCLIAAGISIVIVIAVNGIGTQPQHQIHLGEYVAEIAGVWLRDVMAIGVAAGIRYTWSPTFLCPAQIARITPIRATGPLHYPAFFDRAGARAGFSAFFALSSALPCGALAADRQQHLALAGDGLARLLALGLCAAGADCFSLARLRFSASIRLMTLPPVFGAAFAVTACRCASC